jgi:2-polyprenyl-3-methyl-5-hydroxy-6-metoxy-1,4-benzoquinol methylase
VNFDFHTTKKVERDQIMSGEYKWIDIHPSDMTHIGEFNSDRGKSIVWIEDADEFTELDFHPIYNTLKLFEVLGKNYKYDNTPYFSYWHELKGDEYCRVRIQNLYELFYSMKLNGLMSSERDAICVTDTGERMDGQTRAVVAQYLGITKIKAKMFKTNWKEVSQEWVDRRIKANKLSFPENYYYIKIGDYENMAPKPAYVENANRWEDVLSKLVEPKGKTILDVGCNEGINSIKASIEGANVIGVDYEFIHGAGFHKVLYERHLQKDLPVEFISKDILEYQPTQGFDVCLCLNVIYHIPKIHKLPLLRKLRKYCRVIVMQGNLRKLKEHERFYGITVGDMRELLTQSGFKNIQVVEYGDKPIVIGR